MEPVEAVIFDMDGVLVDTEFTYLTIERQFFAEHGVELTQADHLLIAGGSREQYERIARGWWARAQVPPEEADKDPLELLDAYFAASMPPLASLANPGLVETLDGLAARGVAVALASSSSHEDIEAAMGACGVLDRFSAVLSGEDFAETKPNPEIYLKTLERLGLPASRCIAVEDSDRGVAAGLAAGLRVAAKEDERIGFAQEGATWKIRQLPEVLAIVDACNGGA